jgi:ABC-type uncharacterized transport system permease subunit
MYDTALHAAASLAYAVLALVAYWRVTHAAASGTGSKTSIGERVALIAAVVVHGVALYQHVVEPDGLRFGFAVAVSATLWLGMIFFSIESLLVPIDGLRLLLLPASSVASLLPLVLAHGRVVPHTGYAIFIPHLAIAFLAYSLITIAALHALLMMALDRRLHQGTVLGDATTAGPLARFIQTVLDQLPSLLTMESLLFRLIGVGFVALTATVVTGVMFTEAVFGRPLRFDHKTVFTILSWMAFGALLIGRWQRGWRGRTALRFTLGGFAMLLLAYAGSRFVLEVILQR